MDLTQTKLSKSEWVSIEVPVSEEEKNILTLINNGYDNVNIKNNDHSSMMSLMKIDYTKEIESYLYTKYFEPDIVKMISKTNIKNQWNSIIDTKVTSHLGLKTKQPNLFFLL